MSSLVSDIVSAVGKVKDMTGLRFGRLVVESRAGSNNFGAATWDCLCDCGNRTVVKGSNLRRKTKSCGCLQREIVAVRSRKWDCPECHGTKSHGNGKPHSEWCPRALERYREKRIEQYWSNPVIARLKGRTKSRNLANQKEAALIAQWLEKYPDMKEVARQYGFAP